MLVGARLRRLREAGGVSRADAGWAIRASESKISRIELGRVAPKERDLTDLLALYGGAESSERETLLSLARQATTPGWWHPYLDILPDWFERYLGLEATASVLHGYETQFVPGLLQTRDYARAVINLGYWPDPDEIDRRVELRMERQRLLTRAEAPRLVAVLDEAVLRRPVGGHGVMRAQLYRLVEATKLPNVTVQVVPLVASGRASFGGAFTILRFSSLDLPDMVYIELLRSALYFDGGDEVAGYTAVMDRLRTGAEPPERTAEILHAALHRVDALAEGSGPESSSRAPRQPSPDHQASP